MVGDIKMKEECTSSRRTKKVSIVRGEERKDLTVGTKWFVCQRMCGVNMGMERRTGRPN